MKLILPVPPSLNVYYRKWGGRIVKSKEGRGYGALVLEAAAGQLGAFLPHPKGTEIGVRVTWYREAKRGDLDNRLKCLLDAMQGVLYVSDSQIVRLEASRFEDPRNPRVEVEVWLPEIN